MVSEDAASKIHFSISEGLTLIVHQPRSMQKSVTDLMGRRMTKCSMMQLAGEGGPPRRESRMGLMKQPSMMKGFERRESAVSHNRPKSVFREADTTVPPVPSKPQKPSEEKARRLSKIVETLNKEREEKIKEQRRNKMMTFEQVVSAAINEQIIEDDNSVMSG